MAKKDYQKPTMEVEQLQQRHHILVGSEPETLRGSQGATQEEDTWYELE